MDLRKRFVVKGKNFRLSDQDPSDTAGWSDQKLAEAQALENTEKLAKLQQKLYAQHKYAVLVVLQAMDAGGKDGTIKHVLTGLNPQGCDVTAFKQPSTLEKEHDFLWRIHQAVPPRGMIGIFNRSQYEDVLVVRVHELVPDKVWSKRYEQIRDFEKMLSQNDVAIAKFFLNISKQEQESRFKARLSDPDKNWKSSPSDFEERKFWDDYQRAYQDALSKCSRKHAPWYVIPSDKKWFRNLAISQILVDTLEDLHLQYPAPQSKTPSAAGAK